MRTVDRDQSRGSEEDREWQKNKERLEREGGNESALSRGIYSIDRLLPINYPQKLFLARCQQHRDGGAIGRRRWCGSGKEGQRETDRERERERESEW